jgi:hypothetical protein
MRLPRAETANTAGPNRLPRLLDHRISCRRRRAAPRETGTAHKWHRGGRGHHHPGHALRGSRERQLKSKCVGIALKLHIQPYRSIIDDVASGKVDFGLIHSITSVPERRVDGYGDQQILYIAPLGHRFAKSKTVSCEDLIGELGFYRGIVEGDATETKPRVAGGCQTAGIPRRSAARIPDGAAETGEARRRHHGRAGGLDHSAAT